MAVVLRLQRTGKPKAPHYRIVAIEKSNQTRGRALEVVGHFHPRDNKKPAEQVVFDMPRLEHWLSVGALPSETVAGLIRRVKNAGETEKK